MTAIHDEAELDADLAEARRYDKKQRRMIAAALLAGTAALLPMAVPAVKAVINAAHTGTDYNRSSNVSVTELGRYYEGAVTDTAQMREGVLVITPGQSFSTQEAGYKFDAASGRLTINFNGSGLRKGYEVDIDVGTGATTVVTQAQTQARTR